MNNVRVRDLLEKQQTNKSQQEIQQEQRAARLAENARKHLAEEQERNDPQSWLNPKRISNYLTSYPHDASPVEVQACLELLETSTIFSKEDRENGSAVNTAIAMVRGEI